MGEQTTRCHRRTSPRPRPHRRPVTQPRRHLQHPRDGALKRACSSTRNALPSHSPSAAGTLRNKIIWTITNAIPSSGTDCLSNTYEVIYLLTRSPHYFFDLDAIRRPPTTRRTTRNGRPSPPRTQRKPSVAPGRSYPGQLPALWHSHTSDARSGLHAMKRQKTICHPLGKTRRRLALRHYHGNPLRPPTYNEPPVLPPRVRVCVAWRRWRDLNPRWG